MIEDNFNLQRFISAQDNYDMYQTAIHELNNGRKRSHWVWFIFPQLKGLGYSYNSQFYGISGLEEAKAYLQNEILNDRLRKACDFLINYADRGGSMNEILGGIDALKVFSCLTLFDQASPNEFFAQCLEKCYEGRRDDNTLKLLNSL